MKLIYTAIAVIVGQLFIPTMTIELLKEVFELHKIRSFNDLMDFLSWSFMAVIIISLEVLLIVMIYSPF